MGRRTIVRDARIVMATIAFGVLLSAFYELMFGSGLPGLPKTLAAACLGGLFWGTVISGLVHLWGWLRPRI